jgi:hypothetical protein
MLNFSNLAIPKLIKIENIYTKDDNWFKIFGGFSKFADSTKF